MSMLSIALSDCSFQQRAGERKRERIRKKSNIESNEQVQQWKNDIERANSLVLCNFMRRMLPASVWVSVWVPFVSTDLFLPDIHIHTRSGCDWASRHIISGKRGETDRRKISPAALYCLDCQYPVRVSLGECVVYRLSEWDGTAGRTFCSAAARHQHAASPAAATWRRTPHSVSNAPMRGFKLAW